MKRQKQPKLTQDMLREFVDSKPDWFKKMADYYSPNYEPEKPRLVLIEND